VNNMIRILEDTVLEAWDIIGGLAFYVRDIKRSTRKDQGMEAIGQGGFMKYFPLDLTLL